MGIFTKLSYNKKAKEIAKRREMQELIDYDFDELTAKIQEYKQGDFSLFADLVLYSFYRFPCAYTASNVIALYVDVYNGKKLDEEVELANYEFFLSVGKFLEKGSVLEDVFDAKEYFISLAEYYILKDEKEFKKAFDTLVNIPVSYMGSDTQYLAGMLYNVLGYNDIAKKVLETSIDDMTDEERASASLVLAKLSAEDKIGYLKNAVLSNLSAVKTEAVTLLNELGESEYVVEKVDFEGELNAKLYYELAFACAKTGKLDKFSAIKEKYDGEELYDSLYESAKDGERVDVGELNLEINQKRMEEIAESEFYKYADEVTRGMLNREIMQTAVSGVDFEERDYILLSAKYM